MEGDLEFYERLERRAEEVALVPRQLLVPISSPVGGYTVGTMVIFMASNQGG
jgi:hypothetical protein